MSGHNPYCFTRKDGGKHYPNRQLLVFGSRYSEFKKEIIKPTTILVEEPDEYSAVLNDIKTGKLPKGSIALFDRSARPDNALAMVDKNIETVRLYYNIPNDAQSFENIHGDSMPSDEGDVYMQNFASLENDCKRLGGKAIRANSDISASKFLDNELKNADPNDLILLVSHVEPRFAEDTGATGAPGIVKEFLVMPFGDGTNIEIPKNNKGGPACWIFGCNTWDELSSLQLRSSPTLSISDEVTYHEAVFLARKIISDTGNLRQRINAVQTSTFLKGASLELKASPEITPKGPLTSSEMSHTPPTKPTQKVEFVVELVNEGATFVSNDKIG